MFAMETSPFHVLENRIQSIASISSQGLKLLFSCGKQKMLVRGENVLQEGQVARKIYFIESGYLRCFYNKDGKEINLQFALEHAFITNLKSLRTNLPSEYNMQAGESTLLWEFSKDDLLRLYAQSPEVESFGRNLLEALLIAQEEHANLFKLSTPLERYQYLASHHPELLQRISLSQLSSYLGIARETLSRIRKNK